MMIWDYLRYYYFVHPIRFWVIIGLSIGVFLLLFFLFNQLSAMLEDGKSSRGKRKKTKHKKKGNDKWGVAMVASFVVFFIISFGAVKFFKHEQVKKTEIEVKEELSSPYLFGIDISQYQNQINWPTLSKSPHPIKFVIARATMGLDGYDTQFDYNWENLQHYPYVRGAYHYYRPNENGYQQFQHFASKVQLKSGDLPPILDIERRGHLGLAMLRIGVLNWLQSAEKAYKKKPIVYTGRNFYERYLKGYIENYPIWIASYTDEPDSTTVVWQFHQFSDNLTIKGISTPVDGNHFNGNMRALNKLRIE